MCFYMVISAYNWPVSLLDPYKLLGLLLLEISLRQLALLVTGQSKKSTGVTNNINNGSVLLKFPNKA